VRNFEGVPEMPGLNGQKKFYFLAVVGVIFTGAGVGVSRQIHPNGKYFI